MGLRNTVLILTVMWGLSACDPIQAESDNVSSADPATNAYATYLLCIDTFLVDRVVLGDVSPSNAIDMALSACSEFEEAYLPFFLTEFKKQAGRELSDADIAKARGFLRSRARQNFEQALENHSSISE